MPGMMHEEMHSPQQIAALNAVPPDRPLESGVLIVEVDNM
jgi:hypothetical protein